MAWKRHSPRRGLTLAELLIALALMAMLLTAATMGIYAAQTAHAFNNEKAQLVARTQGIVDRIQRDVRRGVDVSVPDARTVRVEMPGGETRQYQWDGTEGGGVVLSVTNEDGTSAVTLSVGVRAFVVTDADPSVRVRVAVAGDLAETETTVTAIPRRELF